MSYLVKKRGHGLEEMTSVCSSVLFCDSHPRVIEIISM